MCNYMCPLLMLTSTSETDASLALVRKDESFLSVRKPHTTRRPKMGLSSLMRPLSSPWTTPHAHSANNRFHSAMIEGVKP